MRLARVLIAGLVGVSGAVAGAASLAPRLAAQAGIPQSRAETSTIRGRVIASDTGLGVRGAEVMMRVSNEIGGTVVGTPASRMFMATTDAEGRFQIDQVVNGRYTLMASRVGYIRTGYGQRRPGDGVRHVDITKPQRIEGLDIALQIGSVLVVRVTDDFGDPISEVSIEARKLTPPSSPAEPLLALEAYRAGTRTNDRGEARLSGLAPGEYYVSATTSPSYRAMTIGSSKSRRTFAQTYYPGTTSLGSAVPVTVLAEQQQSVTFPLTVVQTATIKGFIRMSDGQPATAGSIRLGSISLDLSNPVNPMTPQPNGSILPRTPQTDGSFALFDVPPGSHTLTVSANPPGSRGTNFPGIEYAQVPITVAGGDINDLMITTSKGSTITGRIVFDDGPRYFEGLEWVANSGTLRLVAASPDDEIVSAGVFTPQRGGAFELSGVIGKGVLRLPPNAVAPFANGASIGGWHTKAVIIDGEDVTDTSVEFAQRARVDGVQIVVTQKRAEVMASVTDGRGAVTANCVVVLFPEKPVFWTTNSRFISVSRPNQNGEVKLSGLPGGSYLAAAVEFLTDGDEYGPGFLKRLAPVATRIAVVEGESKSITLRVVQPK
jgi:hypothetical protein